MQQDIEREEPTGHTHARIGGKLFENHIVSLALSAVGEAVEEGDGNDEEEYSPRIGSTQVRHQVRECMDAIRKDRGRKKLEADARQAQRATGWRTKAKEGKTHVYMRRANYKILPAKILLTHPHSLILCRTCKE